MPIPLTNTRSNIQTYKINLRGANVFSTIPLSGNVITVRDASGIVTIKADGDITNITANIDRVYRFDQPFGNNTLSISSTVANDVVTFDIGYGLIIPPFDGVITAVTTPPTDLNLGPYNMPHTLLNPLIGGNPQTFGFARIVFDNTSNGAVFNAHVVGLSTLIGGAGPIQPQILYDLNYNALAGNNISCAALNQVEAFINMEGLHGITVSQNPLDNSAPHTIPWYIEESPLPMVFPPLPVVLPASPVLKFKWVECTSATTVIVIPAVAGKVVTVYEYNIGINGKTTCGNGFIELQDTSSANLAIYGIGAITAPVPGVAFQTGSISPSNGAIVLATGLGLQLQNNFTGFTGTTYINLIYTQV